MNRTISSKGKTLNLLGTEITVGSTIPAFKVTGTDFQDITEQDFFGKDFIISVVPSLDTPVCSIQTKKFNQIASEKDVKVLTVSMDLPFAQRRWCGAEGVNNVTVASDFKYHTFGKTFGVLIEELGILARAVFVCDPSGKVTHAEYVAELSEEPSYSLSI